MDIAIVGGNSQVGTELAFLFRDNGHDVTPVVRNRLGSSFLIDHGFDCAIGTLKNDGDAERILVGVDLVVVAAYAPPFTGGVNNPREARKTNDAIVENAFEYAPDGATVVYFSTVSAFGTDLYREGEQWRLYAREKRHFEAKVKSLSDASVTDGYAFRLGHVLGQNQNRTQHIKSAMPEKGTFVVRADPLIPSNTVHTVTLKEAIERVANDNFEQTLFSIFNEPQWTWGDVLEFYAPNRVDIKYDVPSYGERQSWIQKLFSAGWGVVLEYKNYLIPYMVYLPEIINRRLMHRSRKGEVGDDIATYRRRNEFHIDEFDFKPIDEQSVLGLTPTDELLASEPTVDDIFEPDNEVE